MAPYWKLPLQPPLCHRRARRCPEERGRGRPVGGHYRDVTGRGAVAAPALRRLASDTAATGAARAGRRLGCAGTCDVGLEGGAAGRGRSRKVREVELVLLHRGRAMDFAVGLSPFQDGIAAAGAVGGRGGGTCSGLGVDAAGPPREAAGGGGAVDLGLSMILFFCMPVHGSRLLRGRARRLGDGSLRHAASRVVGRPCGASAGDPVRHHGVVWGQRRARESSGLFGRSRRAADEASIWRPSGSITTAESRSSTLARLAGVWGVVGAWVGASGLRREAARRLPRPRKRFLGVDPPPVFFRWGHVTRPQNIFG